MFHHSTNECFLSSIIVANNVLYPTSYSFVVGVLDMIYYILFLECEITSHHSTMAIFLLLHFVELQLDFVISTNFKSPCGVRPCSTILLWNFFWVIDWNCYNCFAHIWILTFFHQIWIYKTKENKNSFHNNLSMFITKNNQNKKKFIEAWIFYPKFIHGDSCQMVNVNVLTLLHFGILYLTIYFQTYKIYIITTIEIRSKIQHNYCTIITFVVI